MKALFGFKPYKQPKKCLFKADSGKPIIDKNNLYSWSTIEKEAIIIGEDDTSFVYELKEYTVSDTTDPLYGKTVLLPLGFHKTRLIKWLCLPGEQLKLFE